MFFQFFVNLWEEWRESRRNLYLTIWQEKYERNERRIFRLIKEIEMMEELLRIIDGDGLSDAGWHEEPMRVNIRRAAIIYDMDLLRKLKKKRRKLEIILGDDKKDFDPTWYWVRSQNK